MLYLAVDILLLLNRLNFLSLFFGMSLTLNMRKSSFYNENTESALKFDDLLCLKDLEFVYSGNDRLKEQCIQYLILFGFLFQFIISINSIII